MEVEKLIEFFLWTLKTEKRISLNTYKSYFYDLRVFSNWLKDRNYNLNTSNILLNFNKYLKEKKHSESSISRKIGVLSTFFKYCNEEKKMNISIPNKKSRNRLKVYRSFLEQSDLDKMRNYLTKSNKFYDKRLLCIIEILYSTGMRVSELLNLKIIEINEIKKNRSLKIIGKGGAQRVVFFTDICINAIEDYLKYISIKLEYFFPFTRQRVFQMLKNLATNVNIELYRVFPHSFRHRLLTDLVKKGMNLISVQKIAGHKQISTTEKYTHVEDYLYEEIYKYHPLFNKKL